MRKLLLEHYLSEKQIILPPNFSVNSLAHISDGYTPGSLKMAVERVLTPKRVSELQEDYCVE
jgi:IQ and AAA domain-containing protein